MSHSKLDLKKMEPRSGEAISEDANWLIMGGDVLNMKLSFGHTLAHKVVINLYMFSASMEDGIASKIDSKKIITPKDIRSGQTNMKIE